MKWYIKLIGIFGATVLLIACQKGKASNGVDLRPKAFHKHSCAACGMIIREQSAPRGQIVYRGGKHHFFCSISDMMTTLEMPSRHGKPLAVYTEVMDPHVHPNKFVTAGQTWVKATDAHYLLGYKKVRVMGVPVLVYQTKQDAQQIAKKYKASVYSWQNFLPAWRKARDK